MIVMTMEILMVINLGDDDDDDDDGNDNGDSDYDDEQGYALRVIIIGNPEGVQL